MFIICVGNPADGFSFYGPFDERECAARWADLEFDGDWWVAVLEPAEEEQES